jgi:hypothetical protein
MVIVIVIIIIIGIITVVDGSHMMAMNYDHMSD